jgi:hypothetical protein
MHALADATASTLGPRLLEAAVVGSLAHGGFSRRYSDLDLALVVEDGLRDPELASIRAIAAELSADWAGKLSIFWTDRSFATGRFPPLDRVDLIDHGVGLVARERVRPPRPSLAEIRQYLSGTPLETWSAAASRFAAADALAEKDRKPYLRALLYPARFVMSWQTGRMASNDDAVAYCVDAAGQSLPKDLDTDLLRRALECRRAAADSDRLFADRGLLPAQVEACQQLASAAD